MPTTINRVDIAPLSPAAAERWRRIPVTILSDVTAGRVVPDPRSFFLSLAYTFAPLPATPMRVRLADQRVGYFTEDFVDFGDEFAGDRRTHYIKRWRLEKKDPTAAISEPKEPIRVVLDRNIPEKWRGAVREGVLAWNKAFERAGFRNALTVEQQPADADWTAFEGVRMLAVRWFAMEGPGAVAVGPHQSDPRTGEILRAAAIIPESWVRGDRLNLADTEPPLAGAVIASLFRRVNPPFLRPFDPDQGVPALAVKN